VTQRPEIESEPGWATLVLDGPEAEETPHAARTVRAEFLRRVQRADLGPDEGPVRRAGLLALDGDLARGAASDGR
jgi:hypothetical protein